MASPTIYDHYSASDTDYPDGIYRVVGTGEESVTLLQVGDADDQRVNTGKTITVSYNDLSNFESAENPDGNRPVGATVRSQLEMIYWSLRVFVQQLATNPLLSLLAILVILIGNFGERIVPLPDIGYGILIIIGALGLAYIGSGRL
jgi:hypothetical protein